MIETRRWYLLIAFQTKIRTNKLSFAPDYNSTILKEREEFYKKSRTRNDSVDG